MDGGWVINPFLSGMEEWYPANWTQEEEDEFQEALGEATRPLYDNEPDP